MTHSVDAALGDRATFESGALNVLLEAMREAVVITTVGLEAPGPTIIFVNAAFERVTGYARREVLGENPRMFQGPETSRDVLDRMRLALKAGETFEGETINYRKNGGPFLLHWAVVPIFDDFDKKVAWLSLQDDRSGDGARGLGDRAVTLEEKLHHGG